MGKTHRVDHARGELVERPLLAQFVEIVAAGGEFLRHEMVVQRVAVAAGAAQPQDLPVVDDLRLGFAEDHRAHLLAPVRQFARAAVRVEQRRVAAEPFGVPAAGREAPAPGDAIAALDDDRAAGSRQVRTPGEDAVAVAEHLARGLLGQIRRDHRAAGILPQAPRRAAVALRQRVQDLGIGQRVEFGAARASAAAACGRCRDPSSPRRFPASPRGRARSRRRLRAASAPIRAPARYSSVRARYRGVPPTCPSAFPPSAARRRQTASAAIVTASWRKGKCRAGITGHAPQSLPVAIRALQTGLSQTLA